MLFNSLEFLIFLPVVVITYFLLPFKARWFWLLISSCAFYMAFVPVYVLILFGTIIVDYFAGLLIEKSEGRKRKLFLVLSLFANIGTLCVFKYYNFFIGNVEGLSLFFHHPITLAYLKILLPIGLSFHTFQAMSYTIEVYRNNQKAEKHFGIYALYVMFFPQLVAGPIERPQNILHQLKERNAFSSQNIIDGLRQILFGFFKKVVIADRLALYVNPVFNNYSQYHFLNIIIACVFFAFQVYTDFSGYSDIAIGCARLMGYNLMTNFDQPFLSKNITEFWRRWHISLSTWLRDYLFAPISIAKRGWGMSGVLFALIITFLISGLWHGANWTFVIYGGLQGIACCYEILTIKSRRKMAKIIPSFIYNNISILLTFSFSCIAWTFFRAQSIHDAVSMITRIFTLNAENPFSKTVGSGAFEFNKFSWLVVLSGIALMFIIERFSGTGLKKFNIIPNFDMAIGALLMIIILSCGVFNQTTFIYFQF